MASSTKQREDLINLGYGFLEPKVLLSAVKLGVFEFLASEKKPLPTPAIASHFQGNLRAWDLFCNALAAMGFLTKSSAGYANSAVAKAYLLANSPRSVRDSLMLNSFAWEGWSFLEMALQRGGPLRPPDMFQQNPEETRVFIRAMHNMSLDLAPAIARKIPLKKAKTLLDLGGGPGTYAIAFCKANPQLKAAIFDLPGTLNVAREIVGESGLNGRVELLPGDFVSDDLSGRYDAVFISNIVHCLGEAENQDLMKKVFDAMNPGGLVMVKDFVMDAGLQKPAFGALFSLNMLLFTMSGRSYSYPEISGWLKHAGFAKLRKTGLPVGSESAIVCAVKP